MTISGFGIENDTKISEIFDRSGEEPIRGNENETYRLTSIIPSNQTKEFYTVTISGFSGELNYKLIKDPAGSAQNAAVENAEVETKTIKLNPRQINALKRALDTSDFWNLETCGSYINYDDDTYIAEGVKDGKYHISCRQRAYAVDEKYYYVLCKAFMDMLPEDELGGAETTAYDPEKEDILYFWSAYGSRSLEGARYSYFRKDADKPQPKLSNIYKNGTSDFEETISKIENGNGRIRVIHIYNPQNQKAEIDLGAEVFKKIKERQSPRYNSFSRIESRIIDKAPSVNIIQGIDIYWDNHYSSHLEKFGEGSIRDSEEEIYRCLYDPSMTNAYDIIKVTARKDGGELFYAKRDFDNNTATKTYDLTKEQVEGLKKAFKEADFWNTLVTEGTLGTDGDNCVIEAVKNGRYHIMDRWAPDYNWHTRSGARECYELSEAFRRLVPIEDQYYFSGFSAGLQQKEIKKDAL